MMKRWRLIAIYAAAMVAAIATPVFAAEMVDRIVATVNGEIITLRDFNARYLPIAQVSNLKTQKETDDLRRQVLDAMIDQILTINEGKRKNHDVTEKELDAAIARIKQSNNLTQEKMEAEIRARGGTPESFRRDLKVDIIRSKLINYEVKNRVVVTDEMVEAYIKRYGAPPAPETGAQPAPAPAPAPPSSGQSASGMVHIRNISFRVPMSPTQGQVQSVMEKAAKIRAEIQGGLDFASAAAMHSEASNKEEGGDMGLIAWKDLNPQLRQELQSLKAGEVSRPVFIGGAVQLFQIANLEGDRPPVTAAPYGPAPTGGPTLQKDRVRQILIESRLKEKYEEWLRELRAKATIKVTL